MRIFLLSGIIFLSTMSSLSTAESLEDRAPRLSCRSQGFSGGGSVALTVYGFSKGDIVGGAGVGVAAVRIRSLGKTIYTEIPVRSYYSKAHYLNIFAAREASGSDFLLMGNGELGLNGEGELYPATLRLYGKHYSVICRD